MAIGPVRPSPVAVAGTVLALVVAVAALAGRGPLVVAVVLLALVVVVDAHTALSRRGPAPVLPAALAVGVGLPLMAAWNAIGSAGWFVVVVFATAAVAAVAGRRRSVCVVLGRTLLAGLLAGLGAAGAVLLYDVAAATLLTAIAVVVAVEASRVGVRYWFGEGVQREALGAASTAVLLATAVGLGTDAGAAVVSAVGAAAFFAVMAAGPLRAAVMAAGSSPWGAFLSAGASTALAVPAVWAVLA